MLDEYDFALCLTHDVDRPYKTYQSLYYGLKEFDFYHIKSAFSKERPYWQFENIMELEEELGVRSTFYFLDEKNLFKDKSLKEWFKPKNWKLYTGRYDIQSDEIKNVIRKLDKGGWEVGLHGSHDSFDEFERLKYEKEVLEDILGHEIHGIRQHYLNLKTPDTWENHSKVGLKYDTSLGSSTEIGFSNGYQIKSPLDNDFAVFPLTIMETPLINNSKNLDAAWKKCKELLKEAKENNAVMTILWHLRVFNEKEFTGYAKIYRKIIEKAKEMNGWVGPVRDAYEHIKNESKTLGGT
ncbi:MAG: polysaccharide deacetylase family protein [Thermoplasmatota archaeon]